MGNSLEQYRSAIGKWHLGRMQRIRNQSLPTIDQHTDICTGTCKKYPIYLLNVLAILLISLVIALVYRINQYQPNIKEFDPIYTSCTNSSAKEINFSDLAAATGGIVPFQCHRALLVISGVEQNPGPETNAIDIARKHEDIIAELCIDAPNIEIRDCLRSYNPKNNIRQHRLELGKSHKPVIVSTLEFLAETGQEQFNKAACINTLICRIQNLFPDVCNICKAEYCVKRDDISLLSCEICGQGSHNVCIREHLGLQEGDALDPKNAIEKLNPTNFSGFHYLCGACKTDTIPDKEAGLLKKQSTVVTDTENETSVSQQPSVENRSETTTEENNGDNTEAEIVTEQPTQTENSTEDQTQVQQESNENTPNQLTQSNRDVQSQQETVGNQDQVQSQLQHQTNPTTTICPFYKKGTCRFGVMGRGCSQSHPKQCKKLLQHGNKAPNGCTLGRANCDKFHPKMCHTSLTKGVCYDTNCQSRHVNGTKRTKLDEKIVDQMRLNKGSKDTATKKPGNRTKDSGDFLGVLHTLKVELLEAMDTKIAQYMSVQSPSHQTGNYLRTATPMMRIAEPAPYMNHGLQGPLHSMTMQSGQPWGMTVPGQPVYLPTGMNQMAPVIMPLRSGTLNY